MKIKEWFLRKKAEAIVCINNLYDKMDADDKLVVALVLIAVAVGLCIIFRNQINALVTNIFTNTGKQVNELYKGTLS